MKIKKSVLVSIVYDLVMALIDILKKRLIVEQDMED